MNISSLRSIITSSLQPLVCSDYWLLDVPYYTNIGDTLIWEGTRDFLASVPFKCKGMYSIETFVFPEIPESDIILLQGGGNFGDVWIRHQVFREKVLEHYPKNRCIVLPQTVYYEKEENLRHSIEVFSRHKRLTVCARDKVSFDFLKANFTNEILLVPDMAFCIDIRKHLDPFRLEQSKPGLLVKRVDKELGRPDSLKEVEGMDGIVVSDWPTIENGNAFPDRTLLKLLRRLPRSRRLLDIYARCFYRWYLIRTGVRFLSPYEKIYTTRLHAAILGILLGKDVVVFDNSYGKNRQFYETWLQDSENVELIRQ